VAVRRVAQVATGKDLCLQRQFLEHRLDHEIAIGEVAELRGQCQSADRRIFLLLRQAPLFDATREVAVDRRPPPLAELVVNLAADRLVPSLHADLCDPRAHRPEPDDTDLPNLHGARSYFAAASVSVRAASDPCLVTRMRERRPTASGEAPARSAGERA